MDLSNNIRGLHEEAFICFIQEHISKILNDNEKLQTENEKLKKHNEYLKNKLIRLSELISEF